MLKLLCGYVLTVQVMLFLNNYIPGINCLSRIHNVKATLWLRTYGTGNVISHNKHFIRLHYYFQSALNGCFL